MDMYPLAVAIHVLYVRKAVTKQYKKKKLAFWWTFLKGIW
jgi:hypothetical protein